MATLSLLCACGAERDGASRPPRTGNDPGQSAPVVDREAAWEDVLEREGLVRGDLVAMEATADRSRSPVVLDVTLRRTDADAAVGFTDSGHGAMAFSFDGAEWRRRDVPVARQPVEREFPPGRSTIRFGVRVQPADSYRVLVRFHDRSGDPGVLLTSWADAE